MLVLSRRTDETVVINDNIRVTVIEVQGDSVRLGFDLPRDVKCWREEVWDRIQEEREEST